MINKLIISALSGATLIGILLMFNGFNPLNNQRWLVGAGLLAASSTAIADLSTQKKPTEQMRELLKRNLRELPAGSPAYQQNLELLISLNSIQTPDF